jgi:hypothetical protein
LVGLADGTTVKGVVVLFASGPPNGIKVEFQVTGGLLHDTVVATGSRSLVGWIGSWSTNSVSNGTYSVHSVATDAIGTVRSPDVTVKVAN